jgi:FkbM family methyltransferase
VIMSARSELSLLWLRLRKVAAALTAERTRAALLIGVSASIEHREALRGSNFRTVVDVGANRGQFALFCRTEFPQARIISFEPLSAPAAHFRKIFGNDELVTLHEMALGSVAGRSIMHVTAEDDGSSLLAVGDTQAILFGTREVASQAVTVRRLDEVVTSAMLSAAALLKIDVQGFEMEVLRGAVGILSSFRSVYVECSYLELYSGQALINEAIEFLYSAGFTLAGVFNQAADDCGRPVQADVLFHRSASGPHV